MTLTSNRTRKVLTESEDQKHHRELRREVAWQLCDESAFKPDLSRVWCWMTGLMRSEPSEFCGVHGSNLPDSPEKSKNGCITVKGIFQNGRFPYETWLVISGVFLRKWLIYIGNHGDSRWSSIATVINNHWSLYSSDDQPSALALDHELSFIFIIHHSLFMIIINDHQSLYRLIIH